MARSSGSADVPAVITAARHPRSLDVDTRQRRYAWSMAFRTAAFIALLFIPGVIPKLLCVFAAAFIPPVAVLLANNSDNHREPHAEETAPTSPVAALPGGQVIRGDVVDNDGPRAGA